MGVTGVWDFGIYYVHSRSSEGKDESPDTEEEHGDASQRDRAHERALSRAYNRGSFVVELVGERYRVRLSFVRLYTGRSASRYGMSKHTGQIQPKIEWLVSLAGKQRADYENTSFGDRSILTGRTMSEIKSAIG